MANLMYAEMGMSAIKGIASFAVAGEEAKLARATQKYQRTMAAISAAQNNNALNLNEVATRDQGVFARLSIQTAGMQERAAFDVEAAASGVLGKSIDVGRRALEADKLRADTSLDRQLKGQFRAYGQQRKQVKMDEIFATDVSVIPKPDIGSALMGMGANMLDIWERHNPTDRRISTRLSGV